MSTTPCIGCGSIPTNGECYCTRRSSGERTAFVSPILGALPGWVSGPMDVDLGRSGVLADGTVILVKLAGGMPRTLSFTAEEWTVQVNHRSSSYQRGSASA